MTKGQFLHRSPKRIFQKKAPPTLEKRVKSNKKTAFLYIEIQQQ